MLDAHQLNIFLAAAETLNFTQAARRLHLTQPSVSQHIQALEQHFQTPLFIRVGRSLELTDAGIRLLPMAREMVQQSRKIEEEMLCLNGKIFGHLNVGCSTTPGKYLLPHLLTGFYHRYPDVRVTCHVHAQTQALDFLTRGEVHFALSSAARENYRDLEFRYFVSDPVLLIAPLNHAWAQRASIAPEELLEGEFILRETASGTYQTIQNALLQVDMGIEDLKTILTLGNAEAIALAVQRGLGVGFVSKEVAQNIVPNQVAIIPIEGMQICRDIYLARNPQRPATTAQNAFWDYVSQNPIV